LFKTILGPDLCFFHCYYSWLPWSGSRRNFLIYSPLDEGFNRQIGTASIVGLAVQAASLVGGIYEFRLTLQTMR
jgi:hypothetical protein